MTPGADEWCDATSTPVSSSASRSHTIYRVIVSKTHGMATLNTPAAPALPRRSDTNRCIVCYFTYHHLSLFSSLVVPDTHDWDFSCAVFCHYIQNQLFSLMILIASVRNFPCILVSCLSFRMTLHLSQLPFDLIFCCFSITLLFFPTNVNQVDLSNIFTSSCARTSS